MSQLTTGSLRAEFIKLLTIDNDLRDRRRRDFNQAIFMHDGKPVWTETTLDMILDKFDRAVRNITRGHTVRPDERPPVRIPMEADR